MKGDAETAGDGRGSGRGRGGAKDRSADGGDDRPEPTVAGPVVALRQEIDRLFEEFFRDFGPPFRFRGVGFGPFGQVEAEFRGADEVLPRADCVETDEALVITVELPGVSPEHIEVSLADGMLHVDGIKPRTVDLPAGQVHLSERRYGVIRRSFRVPATVQEDAITAAMEKGVLILTLAKGANAGEPVRRVRVVKG